MPNQRLSIPRRFTHRVATSAALAVLGLQSGCFMADRAIVTTVHDPMAVSVISNGAPSPEPSEVAPDGSQRIAPMAAGTFSTGGSSSSAYELYVDRLPNRTISLRWARPAILGGELNTLVTSDGRITLAGTDDAHALIPLGGSSLRIPYAASLSGASDDNGAFIGYAASVGPPGAPSQSTGISIPFTIETPWSNVVEVRRTMQPRRGTALAFILLSTVLWGAFGTAYVVTAPGFGAGSSGETAFRAVGWGSIGIGAITDLLLLPSLVAPSIDEVVYPAR